MATPQQITSQLIDLLKERDLYDQLPTIANLLQAEVERNQDIHVISAVPLSDKEEKEMETHLTKEWGEHKMVVTVDPVLISGMIIKFKEKVIDLSGKNALQDLETALTA